MSSKQVCLLQFISRGSVVRTVYETKTERRKLRELEELLFADFKLFEKANKDNLRAPRLAGPISNRSRPESFAAQNWPTPKEGDYDIHNFRFRSGKTMSEVRPHYSILMCEGITAAMASAR